MDEREKLINDIVDAYVVYEKFLMRNVGNSLVIQYESETYISQVLSRVSIFSNYEL